MASTINAKTTGVGGIDASGDASGVLSLQTGGTTALTIDTSQNVGIGTSSPASLGQLVISKAASGTAVLAFESQGSWNASIKVDTANMIFSNPASTERMRIDSSGNVGIGTSNPGYKLEVNGSLNASVNIYTTGGGYFFGSSNNYLYQSSSTVATLKIGTGPSYMGFVDVTGTPMLSGAGGTLLFGTGGSNTERMRIDSSGNVGIGTSSPASKLNIAETTYPTFTFTRTGSAYGNGIIQSIGNTGTQNAAITLGNGTDNALVFSVTSTERMRIDSSGNFCIGGTSVGGGAVVCFIANATTVPTSNPSGGGILYVQGGALKYRGSSGTITTIANA